MVAQSVEHCTFNAVVTGSNPVHPTIPYNVKRVFFHKALLYYNFFILDNLAKSR